jgi:hypothetical protein
MGVVKGPIEHLGVGLTRGRAWVSVEVLGLLMAVDIVLSPEMVGVLLLQSLIGQPLLLLVGQCCKCMH